MKPDTTIVVIYAACFSLGGACVAYVTGVTQYGADEVISSKAWSVIFALTISGALTNLAAFLNPTVSDWKKQRDLERGERLHAQSQYVGLPPLKLPEDKAP